MAGASGWAPAKLILFGEHAVSYGEPALGIVLSRGVRVRIVEGDGAVTIRLPAGCSPPRSGGPTPESLFEAAFGEQSHNINIDIELEVPPQGGLGTSAALAVALIRARRAGRGEHAPESTSMLFREAMQIEHIAHGRSSGLDPALVLHGPSGPVWFRPGTPDPVIEILPPPPRLELVIGMKAPHGGTAVSVGRVAAMKDQQGNLHEAKMRELGRLAARAKSSMAAHDPVGIGQAMTLAQAVLGDLDLVGPEVASAIEEARHLGALGAKMTGAGGAGGAFFALAPDAATAVAIEARWRESGTFVLRESLPRS